MNDKVEYAGVMRRFLALLVDLLVFCAFFFPVTRIVKGVWLMMPNDHKWVNGLFIFDPLCLIFLGIIALYVVVLEGLLSADNALVLAVMFLGLPRRDQKNALRYGLVGAFAFRIAATLLAAYLIRLGWVKLLGGLYLLLQRIITWHIPAAFLGALFLTSGIGNGSAFRMVPAMFSALHERLAEGRGSQALAQARKDAGRLKKQGINATVVKAAR